MSGVGILITRDDASPLLQRVKDSVAAAAISLVMARAIGIHVKDHLLALNSDRHRYGRNYYARAARSVSTKGAGGFALVSINQVGIRLRRFGTAGLPGGKLKPKSPKQFLTIPADPAAYGMRAGEFQDLQLERVLDDNGRLRWALVRRASTAISFAKRKGRNGAVKVTVRPGELRAGGTVMFWLARSVTQRADPGVLPSQKDMAAVGIAAGERYLQRQRDRANGGNQT